MNMKKSGYLSTAAAAALGLAAPAAQAAWTLNMTPGITAISRRGFQLPMLMYWGGVAIAGFLFRWMIVSIVRFPQSKGARAHPPLVDNNLAAGSCTGFTVG